MILRNGVVDDDAGTEFSNYSCHTPKLNWKLFAHSIKFSVRYRILKVENIWYLPKANFIEN